MAYRVFERIYNASCEDIDAVSARMNPDKDYRSFVHHDDDCALFNDGLCDCGNMYIEVVEYDRCQVIDVDFNRRERA